MTTQGHSSFGRSSIDRRTTAGALAAVAFVSIFVFPSPARAWGASAERLVASKAVDTLPPELREFFEANRDFLSRHVTEPLDLLAKNPPNERRNHFLYLDHYGKFPFDTLPRDYKAAVSKYSRSKLESSGVLPWQIGVYNQKLTAAMREHDWDQVRLAAAYLAAYVAQAHDPFHTTENFDGHLSGQTGVDCASDLIWWTGIRCSFRCGLTTLRIFRTPPIMLLTMQCPRTHRWKIYCSPIAAPVKGSPATRMNITIDFIIWLARF